MSKLDTAPYKGVRDFYPEDLRIRKWLFSVWRNVAEKYGYVEYDASILEYADLYKAKSGDEIVNEQTYTFKDRGDREVTLRPEMTPTVARMVAQKRRELGFPLRWYSIPNLFRYENPQKGRLREHFQLNVDIFGDKTVNADVEIISIAYETMKAMGADDSQFEIRMNNYAGGQNSDFKTVVEMLGKAGITNTLFDENLRRGQAYYTGIVFEIFDTSGENKRSIFGGGRYDNLLDIFGEDKIPAVGFGMGDVTARDFLETHKLLPEMRSETDVVLLSMKNVDVSEVAKAMRVSQINVAVDVTEKDIPDKKRNAEKNGVPFYIVIGENELETGQFTLKNIFNKGEDFSGTIEEIINRLK